MFVQIFEMSWSVFNGTDTIAKGPFDFASKIIGIIAGNTKATNLSLSKMLAYI